MNFANPNEYNSEREVRAFMNAFIDQMLRSDGLEFQDHSDNRIRELEEGVEKILDANDKIRESIEKLSYEVFNLKYQVEKGVKE